LTLESLRLKCARTGSNRELAGMGQNASLLMDNMNSSPRSPRMKNTSQSNASNSSRKDSALMAIGASSNMTKVK
jgi:hypothetical protein